MNLPKPNYSIEKYLEAIIKNDISLLPAKPKNRIELYLECIAKKNNNQNSGSTSIPINAITEIMVRDINIGDNPNLIFTRENNKYLVDITFPEKEVTNEDIENTIKELKKYINEQDNETYKNSNLYTDEEIKKSIQKSKEYVDKELLKINGLEMLILKTLPPVGEGNKLYLVPSSVGGFLDQFIWENSTQSFVPLGTTQINLDQYALKTELPINLSELTNDTNFTSIDDNNSSTNTTYSSNKIEELLADIPVGGAGGGLRVIDVNALPDVGEPNTLYLLLNTINPTENNKYIPYLWYKNTWEKFVNISRDEIVTKEEVYTKEQIDQMVKGEYHQKLIIRLSIYDDRDLNGLEITLQNLTKGTEKKKTYDGENDIEFLIDYLDNYRLIFPKLPNAIVNNIEGVAGFGAKIIRADYTKYYQFGIKISKNDSNPDTRVEYILDAVGKTPVSMDFVAGELNYGGWKDAWFIKNNRPCMLRFNGEVDYYLDKDNQNYNLSGERKTDITNYTYSGNAMSEMPLAYLHEYEDDDYTYHIISNVKVDENYNANAFTDKDGNIQPYAYVGIFPGIGYGDYYRSIGSATIRATNSVENIHNRTKAMGERYSLLSYSMWNYLKILLTMLCKSTDTRSKFGFSYKAGEVGTGQNGGTIASGQFLGKNTGSANYTPFKVLYMESFWGGNIDFIIDGAISKNNKFYIKTTPPYNLTGEGYIEIADVLTTRDVPTAYKIVPNIGMFPTTDGGSSSTYTTDIYSPPSSSSSPSPVAVCFSGGVDNNILDGGSGVWNFGTQMGNYSDSYYYMFGSRIMYV